MRRTQQEFPSPISPSGGEHRDLAERLSRIENQMNEVREMLVGLLHHHGFERAGARSGTILFNRETRLSLAQAAEIIWGESACETQAQIDAYVFCIKKWATESLNGVVLETEVVRKKWYTSREAVQRFQEATGMHIE